VLGTSDAGGGVPCCIWGGWGSLYPGGGGGVGGMVASAGLEASGVTEFLDIHTGKVLKPVVP
jgi:hypothetical protein